MYRKLLRRNFGDGGRLEVRLYLITGMRYIVITTVENKVYEIKKFYKKQRANEYYEKVLREF